MKTLLAICMIVAAASVWAGENPASSKPAPVPVSGEVLEVKNVPNFTYLRLKTKNGEVWAAVVTASVKKGAMVTIENYSALQNFHSKELKKTFSTILLGRLGGSAESAAGSAPAGLPSAVPLPPGRRRAPDGEFSSVPRRGLHRRRGRLRPPG